MSLWAKLAKMAKLGPPLISSKVGGQDHMKTCEFKDQLDLNLIFVAIVHTGAQKSLEGYKAENGVSYTCVPEKVIPVTFPTVESYMKINQNDPKLNNLQARFDIRSYR